jgi:hypothetical protein
MRPELLVLDDDEDGLDDAVVSVASEFGEEEELGDGDELDELGGELDELDELGEEGELAGDGELDELEGELDELDELAEPGQVDIPSLVAVAHSVQVLGLRVAAYEPALHFLQVSKKGSFIKVSFSQ